MPKIQNVSPLGDLEVPALRRTIAAGEVVEVPASVAGSAPTPWTPVPDEDVVDGVYVGEVPDYFRREVVAEDGSVVIEACHPGEGLLAQVDNYAEVVDEVVEKKSSKKTAAAQTAPAQDAAPAETPEV